MEIEKNRKEKTESLRKRLGQYYATIPGNLFTKEWRKIIGRNGYQLLGILIATCDWKTKIWRGNIFTLAEVMGVNEKTVRNQLNSLKRIEGFHIDRFPQSIFVHLPDRLFPVKKSKEDKIISYE